jgi:hypothetical protein
MFSSKFNPAAAYVLLVVFHVNAAALSEVKCFIF